jgi:putative tricarboxylic transport membrane protein
MESSPEFARMRTDAGLFPFSLTGAALTQYVKKAVNDYTRQAQQFNLVR